MQIVFSPKFVRIFKKLSEEIKAKAFVCMDQFMENPQHPSLHIHKLQPQNREHWAITVAYDCRIIFSLADEKTAYFIGIGKHDDVY